MSQLAIPKNIYNANPVAKKIKSLNFSRATYSNDPQAQEQKSRDRYEKNPNPQ